MENNDTMSVPGNGESTEVLEEVPYLASVIGVAGRMNANVERTIAHTSRTFLGFEETCLY